ncbi:MAG: hypothetical protein GPJ54_17725 [Candidatus Heimdallarchaeota archaeon]|nr:hypothetical protein [Candidatus Heimdallarchaeota archaeon]
MKFQFSLMVMGILIFTFFNQTVISQNFDSDPEVKEIRSRIVDVSWNINRMVYTTASDTYNETYVQFEVDLELWNPFDKALISYGSSSCR